MLVNFNLLSGELLINGIALDGLPQEYERHKSYQKLFGNSHVEVMPSHVPGMRFSCQRQYLQHVVHLGKGPTEGSTESDLFVLAVKDDQTWEFIPPRLFERFFPDDFVENCAHWYSVNDGEVEFRPTAAPWISSESNWRLKRNRFQNTWFLEKGGSVLMGMKAQTARLISAIFEPVEKASKLHCSLHNATSILTIQIPRLRLEFSLQPQSSSIHSRQYPGMEIDGKQSLDSLIGLHNKLLLTHQKSHDQVLLIPEGYPFFKRVEGHVGVSIVWQSETTVHAYSIDKFLGRLIDNGSLQSKLFLCYLHALTSFCLPDPLTGKTGTEQALSILRSASVQSFDQIETENREILEKITTLSPQRRYYPDNCQEMQSIEWQRELGVLSQHSGFYIEVKAILERARRMEIFYPNAESSFSTQQYVMKGDLLKRAQIRSASFLVSGFGAEDHTQKYDKLYPGRESDSSSGCSRVFSICKILYEGIPRISEIAVEELLERLWAFLSESDLIHGPNFAIDVREIQYDAKLMLHTKALVAERWCSLHRLICSRNQRLNKFQVMVWLSTIAYAGHIPADILEIMASFWVVSEMQSVLPPPRQSFKLKEGIRANTPVLRPRLRLKNMEATSEWTLTRFNNENRQHFSRRKKRAMKANQDRAVDGFLLDIRNQWPTREPREPQSPGSLKFNDYIVMDSSMQAVRSQFASWWDNRELRDYLGKVVSLLGKQVAQSVRCPPVSIQPQARSAQRLRGFISFDDLLGLTSALEFARLPLPSGLRTSLLDELPASQLVALMDLLEQQAKSTHERWYVEQLQNSVASLRQTKRARGIIVKNDGLERTISDYLSRCQEYADTISDAVISQITPEDRISDSSRASDIIHYKTLGVLAGMKQGPRLSRTLLMEQLTRHRWSFLSDAWKKIFVTYGCSLTMLQHAQRLASLVKSPDELSRELSNPGHTTWDPFEFPESLLLEIESGILIREVQDQIFRQMRASSSGENKVMQLNMGEGKSSVIVPIVAASLANGLCLVRVFVAKPQSRQMFHMLVSKLGGLLGRRVYHMPISRSLKLDKAGADELKRLCQECMSEGGVLLVQPEHVLSLKLMCLEYFSLGNDSIAKSLLETLRFFYTCSRDILDESDENFNVKFELIYTMGLQSSVELSPQRWILIQQVLNLVQKYAPSIEERFPQSIQLDRQPAIPRIRLLRQDAEQALLQGVAKHICEFGIDCLPISRQPQSIRDAVFAYITKLDLTTGEIAAVESSGSAGFWTETTKGPLLLLRGLLAHGVLAFCFGQKRWRVNYGPDTTRIPPTRLCVPYKAKDSPSPRSEFSHPDVVIVLTSLNYYYAGLNDDDLFLAFSHLIKSDQANMEYQLWVNDTGLEQAYRQLVGVNLEDGHHCVEYIFPALRFSKVVVDYFLSQIVFPKEIKEFPDKLSASGWDLGEIKTHPTAGFSGTNDSRRTLPLNVRQLDLPEQNHTNALVLEYLLQPENSVTFFSDQNTESKSKAHVLLETVAALDPPVQVILDVGAQIPKLDNLQLASHWLAMLPKNCQTQAIVFINDTDEICVLDRSGRVEPLHTSPFARQMEACFVFLDEAHTRGIDLKLPSKYRAAVNLGAGITKDKLVQGESLMSLYLVRLVLMTYIACMRMRKLGKGQSVVFCIPSEIESKILTLTGKSDRSEINVRDVLSWAVSETWIEIERHIPLWAVQGRRFERQLELWRNAGEGLRWDDLDGSKRLSRARIPKSRCSIPTWLQKRRCISALPRQEQKPGIDTRALS